MILLDTNVVSEMLKPAPAASVLAWLKGQDIRALALSSVTLAEIRAGLRSLPEGKRRSDLETRAEGLMNEFRIFAFDAPAARKTGDLIAEGRALGRPLSFTDAAIAATALVQGAVLATRDRDFAPFGLPVLNPWIA